MFQATAVFFVSLSSDAPPNFYPLERTRPGLRLKHVAHCKQETLLKSYTLSVLLPVYNEIRTLQTLIDRIQQVPVDKEIIIVDDLSTDGTREYLRDVVVKSAENITALYHDRNQGKGAALRTAIPAASGKYCIVQDGDLEYCPDDYLPILATFEAKKSLVVYGSRFMNGSPKMRPMNRFVNWLLPAMVLALYGYRLTDEATCYKAFETKTLQSLSLKCMRFEFCPEVTAKLLKKGFRIEEIPIRYEARGMSEGKKIRWTDGVEAIWTLIKYRFVE